MHTIHISTTSTFLSDFNPNDSAIRKNLFLKTALAITSWIITSLGEALSYHLDHSCLLRGFHPHYKQVPPEQRVGVVPVPPSVLYQMQGQMWIQGPARECGALSLPVMKLVRGVECTLVGSFLTWIRSILAFPPTHSVGAGALYKCTHTHTPQDRYPSSPS